MSLFCFHLRRGNNVIFSVKFAVKLFRFLLVPIRIEFLNLLRICVVFFDHFLSNRIVSLICLVVLFEGEDFYVMLILKK